jgi:CubicO group peptidase (beta-lactamase class C family)
MARWDAALATPGLLSADSLRAMFAPHSAVPDEASGIAGASYGYGWFAGEVEGHSIRFHDGGNAGFASFNILLPDDDAVIVLLSNVEASLREISLHIVSGVLNDASGAHIG